MIEVEIKLPIHRRSQVERELDRLGFQPGSLVRESDIYFTSRFHDFMKTDEALRIRRSENLSKRTLISTLTYKGAKLDSVSMTRKELETEVADADTCRDILLSLGYRELSPVVKLRQYYTLAKEIHLRQKDRNHGATFTNSPGEIHACVDQVEHLGSFLELEIPVSSEKERENALRKISFILEQIGYCMEETTRYSYLYMLIKNGHIPQEQLLVHRD